MQPIEELAVVALLIDAPEQGVFRGEQGTVVETLSPEVVLVEFADEYGQTLVLAELRVSDLQVLHGRPVTSGL